MADGQTPQERLMAFAQKVMARPMVPNEGRFQPPMLGPMSCPGLRLGMARPFNSSTLI